MKVLSPRRSAITSADIRLTFLHTEKFLLVCNLKEKADGLLQRDTSKLAISTYKSALSKIRRLDPDCNWIMKSGSFQGYSVYDGINCLRFTLEASVAAGYLMSEKYEETIKWIDDTSICWDHTWEHPGVDNCRRRYWNDGHDWWEEHRWDHGRMHYCMGTALKHRGDFSNAIKEFEKMLEFVEPEDDTADAELELLRAELRKIQEERLRKLNAPQTRLKKKQALRRAKRAS